MTTHTVTHRGTVYRLHVLNEIDRRDNPTYARFILTESGWSSGHGEWIRLDVDSIALSYLQEKMPETWKRRGDWEGWQMAFAATGIKVFGGADE